MFVVELIICIKMDLALNNLQSLICHKTQSNKPIKLRKISLKNGNCLPPTWQDLTRGLFFYSGGFRAGGSRARADIVPCWTYACQQFTKCNVSQMNQMSLLDLDSLDVTWVRYVYWFIVWISLEWSSTMLWSFVHQKTAQL